MSNFSLANVVIRTFRTEFGFGSPLPERAVIEAAHAVGFGASADELEVFTRHALDAQGPIDVTDGHPMWLWHMHAMAAVAVMLDELDAHNIRTGRPALSINAVRQVAELGWDAIASHHEPLEFRAWCEVLAAVGFGESEDGDETAAAICGVLAEAAGPTAGGWAATVEAVAAALNALGIGISTLIELEDLPLAS